MSNKNKIKGRSMVGCYATEQNLYIAQMVLAERPVIVGCWTVPNPGPQAAALQRIALEHQLHNLPWYWVLSMEQYQHMLIDVPTVPEDEVTEALRFRVKDLISFPLEEAVVDTCLLPSEAFRGRSRMAFASVAKREMVTAWADALGLAGLSLQSIDIANMVLRNLAVLAAQTNAPAILRLRAEGSIFDAVYEKELCLHREFSIGAEALSPSTPDASGLSIEDDSDWQLDALALELQRSLDYFENQLGLGNIGEVQVVSDTELSDDVIRRLQQRFDFTIAPYQWHDVMDCQLDTELVPHLDIYAEAIGGTLRWLAEG